MKSALGLLVLFVLAALYMRLGLLIPIGWMDEGVIVYPSWRTALGELPYRDFQHLYAPSVFFFNGLLFRVFGIDLSVLRYSLLAVKAVTCVMVFVAARQLSNLFFALIAYAMAVILAGLAWPVSTIPYPSFHGTALCLAGLLAFLSLTTRRRFLLGCAIAGLFFGLAATFKQTMGAFAFLGLALYLLIEEGDWGREPGPTFDRLIRASRWFVLAFTAGLAVLYLTPRNPIWNLVLLISPVLVLTGYLTLQELRSVVGPESRLRAFWGLVVLSSTFLTPFAGYMLFYASIGFGSEFVFNTFTGIPSAVDWISPFPTPTRIFIVWQIGCFGAFATAYQFRRRALGARRAGVLIGLAGFSIIAIGVLTYSGWQARHASWWFWSSSDVLFTLPFVIVGLSLVVLMSRGEIETLPDTGPRRAFRVFTCFATLAIMWLFPAADIWHILPLLPCCLALLAYFLQRFWRLSPRTGGSSSSWPLLAGSLITGLFLILVVPAVHDLFTERGRKHAFGDPLPRASGIEGDSERMSWNAGRLVHYLAAPRRNSEPFVVLSGKSLLYFLTDHVSPVQEYEFLLYLTAIDGIREQSAHEWVDQAELIRRLETSHPRIIDDAYDTASANVRRMYPGLARFVRSHYELEAKFGGFRVWRWDPRRAPHRARASP